LADTPKKTTALLEARQIRPRHLQWKQTVDLAVHAGEIVVIQGPNGAGTTSLLAAINGTDSTHEGLCLVDGQPVATLHGERRRQTLAYMPQQEPQPSGFTVRERVALGAKNTSSIDNALHRLGLQDLANRAVATLSGGEARRCTLAAILAQQSRCLIVDEPTNHMDPDWTERTGQILTTLAKQESRAVLVVLHNLPLANAIADRIITLGPDGTITENPAPPNP